MVVGAVAVVVTVVVVALVLLVVGVDVLVLVFVAELDCELELVVGCDELLAGAAGAEADEVDLPDPPLATA